MGFEFRRNPDTGQVAYLEDGASEWIVADDARRNPDTGEVAVLRGGAWAVLGVPLAPEAASPIPQPRPADRSQPREGPEASPAPPPVAQPSPQDVLAQVVGSSGRDPGRAARQSPMEALFQSTVSPGSSGRRAEPEPPAPAVPQPRPVPDPFEGEPLIDTAARTGQQFAVMAADAPASLFEGIAMGGANLELNVRRNQAEAVEFAKVELQNMQDALADPNLSEPARAHIAKQIDIQKGKLADLMQGLTTIEESGPMVDASERPGFKAGDAIRDAVTDVVGVPDPRDDSFLGKLASGAGSTVPYAATAVLPFPLNIISMTALGVTQNSSQIYKEAKANGASEEDALYAAKLGGALGATEAIPIARALKVLPKSIRRDVTNKVARRLASVLQSSGEEALQEAIVGIGNNLIAAEIYDPERGWSEGVTEAAAIGGILGGGLNVAGQVLTRNQDSDVSEQERTPVTTPEKVEHAEHREEKPRPKPTTRPELEPEPVEAEPEQPKAEPTPEPIPEPATEPVAEGERFEEMPEIEVVDGERRETGRTVRVDRQTGQATVVEEGATEPEGEPEPKIAEAPEPAAPSVDLEDPSPSDAIVLRNEDLAAVETDARTFQYKAGGDQDGVTERLRDVKTWDNTRAGVVLVYEATDGTRTITDGHQRLGLAKRLMAEGQDVQQPAIILREADGITRAEARRIAASKNIAEGSGTALDAAKVIRESGDDPNLPQDSALVRDGRGLAKLSDDGFGMVINGRASERDGAIVGQFVEDQALHTEVLALLAKLKPSTVLQAEQIARDAAANATDATEVSLFGEEDIKQSLYLERAKVLDGATRRVKRERRLFNTLLENRGAITSKGNRLDDQANQRQADDDAQSLAFLSAEANRKGPISDALTEAARKLQGGASTGDATSGFIRRLRDLARGAQDRRPVRKARPDAEPDRGDQGADLTEQGSDASEDVANTEEPLQSEQTEAGEQTLVPGVGPVTDKQRAEAEQAKPKRGGDALPSGGRDSLFGDPSERGDLFDAPSPSNDASNQVEEVKGSVPAEPEGRVLGDGSVLINAGAIQITRDGDKSVAQIGGSLKSSVREIVDTVAKEHEGTRIKGGYTFKTEYARDAFVGDISKPAVDMQVLAEQRFEAAEGARSQTDGDLAQQPISPAWKQPLPSASIGATAMDVDTSAAVMPALRAKLDGMNLKRVGLLHDTKSKLRQGAPVRNELGGLDIVIANAIDPEATMYHEVIHALREMNLFTPQEWGALQSAAAKGWVEKHDIANRYPDLLPSQQIEEAIAEEFAAYAQGGAKPRGSLLARAFAKIVRLFRAIRETFAEQGMRTVEDVFGDVLAGEIGGRSVAKYELTGANSHKGPLSRTLSSRSAARTLEQRSAFANWSRGLERMRKGLLSRTDVLMAGRPGAVLRAAGVSKRQVVMSWQKAKKVQREHPEISDAVLERIPQALQDPEFVLRSSTEEGSIVVVPVLLDDGRVFVVPIKQDANDPQGNTVNMITSAYIKDDPTWLDTEAARGNLIYARDGYRAGGRAYLSGSNSHESSQAAGRTTPRKRKILTAADVFKDGTLKEQRLAPRKRKPQAAAHAATTMAMPAHIPDRRIWEELHANGATMWQRIGGAGAATHDWIDKARIRIQDRFLPVLRAQEAVMRSTGKALPEEQNAYVAETTFSGKVGRHLFEIDEDFTKPIIDIIGRSKGGLTVDGVGEWLTARHAKERNAYIASINPNMPDGGSGMTDAKAQQILDDAAAGAHQSELEEIAALIDKLRKRTLDLRVDAGLMTPADRELWDKQYQNYVPLKGFAETDHSEAYLDVTGVGARFNTRGTETKRAMGRESEAFNPLQGAITQAQEVAIRAEKNRVGQALYELVKSNPSEALWSVKTPKEKRYFNRTTGLVETFTENPASLFLDPNELAVKVEGREQRILFHDQRLARSVGTVGADQMGWFMSLMSMASRYFSAVNTMLDPEFVIRNAVRDMTSAQINIRNFGDGDRNALAKGMIRDWPRAFAAAFRGQSKTELDGEWGKWYDEFDKAGGKVSFWKLEQPEAERADMEKRIRMSYGGIGSRASRFIRLSTRDNPILSFTERFNLAVDNAVRLAAYANARKAGWSKARAAELSKNLTVNFNRRGEWGASINALYPFANAAIQGSQILIRAMTGKRMAKYAIGMVALGAILDQVNAWLSMEDEDGELAYDKIPNWKNQLNLVVMLGKDSEHAATIWMPYGYNVFPYLGQQASKVARGVKDPGDAMVDFADAIVGSFSPLSGNTFQSFITPTMLDPVNEMAINEDWLGRPIRPESPYSDYGPDAYKYYGGASEASKAIADTLNRATGGDIAQPGFIDVSPEHIDHMFGFMAGGAGRFYGRTSDVVAKLLRGEADQIEDRNIPFYRSLQTGTGDWLDRDRYFRFRDEVRTAVDQVKRYNEERIPIPRDVLRIARLNEALKEAEKDRKDSKKKLDRLRDSRKPADQKRAERADLNSKANAEMLKFKKKFLSVAGPRGE
ncbi:MAG: LPD38 domain-containing protein [Pseudomonadota bacterium]